MALFSSVRARLLLSFLALVLFFGLVAGLTALQLRAVELRFGDQGDAAGPSAWSM